MFWLGWFFIHRGPFSLRMTNPLRTDRKGNSFWKLAVLLKQESSSRIEVFRVLDMDGEQPWSGLPRSLPEGAPSIYSWLGTRGRVGHRTVTNPGSRGV